MKIGARQAVVARTYVALRTLSSTAWLSRSTALKSARIPCVIISGVIFTMCAWRIRRRFTTSVICIRLFSSFGCTSTAKMLTCELSISSSTSAGIPSSGRFANSSSTNEFQAQSSSSNSTAIEAAICKQLRSVISVTFSSG